MIPPYFYIVEHPREKKHKCTVAFLRGREGLEFLRADEVESRDWGEALLLHAGAKEILSPRDAGRPLILVDASWRWAERVVTKIPAERRFLPHFETAYPRASKLFRDPPGGLASVEALFAACTVFGLRDESLLDGYRWKDGFLAENRETIRSYLDEAVAPPGPGRID